MLTTAIGCSLAVAVPAQAEPEGAYCSKFAFYGDECNATDLHALTRSSTYSSDNLYVSAGAHDSGGGVYGSLVYANTYVCHPYNAGTRLYARSRNSDTSHNGNMTGSKYWMGMGC